MQLTTTKERVLETVEKDPQAKETLKTLFPEVFEDDKYFNLIAEGKKPAHTVFQKDYVKIDLAYEVCNGKYRNKAFLLYPSCRWELVNEGGDYILIPTRI